MPTVRKPISRNWNEMEPKGEGLMPMYLVEDLIKEIGEALDCLENHHTSCDWQEEPNLEEEESESCAEFAEQYGTGYTRLTCHDHDKMREWSKMLQNSEHYNPMLKKGD